MEKKSIFIIFFLLIAGIVFFEGQAICIQVGLCKQLSIPPINLVVWNLWDDETAWKDMIVSYEASVAADPTRQPVKKFLAAVEIIRMILMKL